MQMTNISTGSINQLHSRLSSSQSPVIVTHMKPDGDAMGSSMGMYHMLRQVYGKDVRIALADSAPANLDFLTPGDISKDIFIYSRRAEQTEETILSSDLIICLDFNTFHRTDTLGPILERSTADKILIDHHLSPDKDKFSLVFSETQISSASELLYHILKMLPPVNNTPARLPMESRVALMTGMTTDTNNFANSVYPSTFAMASELIETGVDRNMILYNIYNRFKESRVRLQGHILKNLMKITDDGVAYIVLNRQTMDEYDVQEGDTEGFVNIPLTIDNVVMSIFVKEDENYARVSIRSRIGVSANTCSKLYFNGGGHENAAGGRLYFGTDISDISKAEEYIEKHTHIFMTRNDE